MDNAASQERPEQSPAVRRGAIVIFGPAASGKTTNAKALASFYGKTRIIDEGENAPRPFPHNALVIMEEALRGYRCVHIAAACKAAGLTRRKNG